MKEKKSKNANLENKRGILFQAGLLVAMSVVLYAFNYSSTAKGSETLGKLEVEAIDEDFALVRPQLVCLRMCGTAASFLDLGLDSNL